MAKQQTALRIALTLTVLLAAGLAAAPADGGCIFVKLRAATAAGDRQTRLGRAERAVRAELAGRGGGRLEPSWREDVGKALRCVAERRGRLAHIKHALDALARTYVCTYQADVSAAEFARQLAELPDVEAAEPRPIRKLSYTPDDALYGTSGQDYFSYHAFPAAWEVTKGSSDVIIAIVDSGIDYEHPDLAAKVWINTGEIAGNGIDDDGNGYTDDVRGWDFWHSGDINSPVADNDPMDDHSGHGTHVAGTAGADTDNGEGVAGTGFNCRIMAVKAGGTSDSPDSIGYGFEGIVYAAANGAHIINCSWGSTTSSWTEQDAIDTALAAGALVVCAAGNESWDLETYPAAYSNTLAVGSVIDSSGGISDFSNYGSWVDVFADGDDIRSTAAGGGYEFKSGTSMASPVVSGLAALIKAHHPDWTPAQITSQIRATAVGIDTDNHPDYAGLLGVGRIDAAAALGKALPGLTVADTDLAGESGGPPNPGQAAVLQIELSNSNGPATDLVLTLTSLTAGVSVIDGVVEHGSLGELEGLTAGFGLSLATDLDLTADLSFRLALSDASTGYGDVLSLQLTPLALDTMAVNKVAMSIASTGSIGYIGNADDGVGGGFVHRLDQGNAESLLYEGGLIIEADGVIFDQIRAGAEMSHDFRSLTGYYISEPGELVTGEGTGRFDNSPVAGGPAMSVVLDSFASDADGVDQCVVLRYTISNPAAVALNNVYVGLFNDWDVGSSYTNNVVRYDSAADVMYVRTLFDPSQPFVAVAPMAATASQLAISNSFSGVETAVDFGIYYDADDPDQDGFTDAEKRQALHAGTERATQSAADISTVVASGPYTIPPQGEITVGFIYAYGEDLDDLLAQVANARDLDLFAVDAGDSPQPPNDAPTVAITSPTRDVVYLADTHGALLLEADVTDDSRPEPGNLSVAWSLLYGPGSVASSNLSSPTTEMHFSEPGAYALQITADDGLKMTSDQLLVVVDPAASSGPEQTAHWDFAAVANGTAADQSGTGRDLVLDSGASQTPAGYGGNGLELNGTSGRGAFSAPDLTAFTLSAWVHTRSDGNSIFPRIFDMPGCLLYLGRDSSSTDTDSTVRFYTEWSDAVGLWHTPPNSVLDNEWVHVAVSYDAGSTGNTPRFYLNGEPVTTHIYGTPEGTPPSNSGDGYVGNSADLNRAWDGYLDELRIHTRVLSAAEIRVLAALPHDNLAPAVDAGADLSTKVARAAVLEGTASDDGLPALRAPFNVQWLLHYGPGSPAFGDDSDATTTVTFDSAGAYRLRLTATDGVATIADDVDVDVLAVPAARFAATGSNHLETDGVVELTVSLTSPENEETSLAVQLSGTATSGVDYTLTPTALTFAAGETQKILTLALTDDAVAEPTETIIVTLANPVGLTLVQHVHTVTLVDDDKDFALALVGAQTEELRFGVGSGLTPGFDSGVDDVTVPAADASIPYVRFVAPEATVAEESELRIDRRSPLEADVIRWRLLVSVPGNRSPVVLTWADPTSLIPPGRRLLLQSLAGETPTGPPLDMTVAHRLEVAESSEFEIAYGVEETGLAFTLVNGWNLAGLPVMTTQTVAELTGQAARDGVVVSTWLWDGEGYVKVRATDTLNAERAYWMYSAGDTVVGPIHGVTADGRHDRRVGWTMFTPVPPDSITAAMVGGDVMFWHEGSRSYFALSGASSLPRYRGYLVFSTEAGTFDLK